ncbi:MAG: PDZ domain-containing protein [Fimbriiglobus sp.]
MNRLWMCLWLLLPGLALAQDVNEANEKAMKAASEKVAPFIVKIETAGGREVIGPAGPAAVRKGTGPTTGLIVAADGFIISSAFNFADKPSDIFVTVPGKPRLVAKIVANDTTRMLTLLKVEAKDLPVPTAFPKKDLQIGQWSLALGRALDPDIGDAPSMSAGIISALGRIFGKTIQTDAKVSPVNYGGPLVAIDGRVMGVLVPASPRGETETTGVEWYDSGIGFAIPLEDVFAVLPKLKAGQDLKRGLMGITAKVQEDTYNLPAIIGAISKDSAAEKAGLKSGDQVIELAGLPIANFSQVQHALGPKYAGDVLVVKVLRDGKEMTFDKVTLTAAVTSFAAPYLGVLPLRDDPEPGVEIRYVYPKSPAEVGGLKAGDRIMKTMPQGLPPGAEAPPLAGRDSLAALVNAMPAGTELKFEVKRPGSDKALSLTVKLGTANDDLPTAIPVPSSAKRALEAPKTPGPKLPKKEPAKKEEKKDDKPAEEKKPEAIETGLLQRTNPAAGREYFVYVPENYDKNVAHGIIFWLHRAKPGAKEGEDLKAIFADFCEKHHFILVGPKSKNAEGWLPSETEEILQDLRTVIGTYTIDRSRVVAHGMGVGGQMAFYLGFNARDLIRGVATTGAALGTQPKEPVPGQPLAFFIVGGEQDPLIKTIAEAKPRLTEKKYPVIYRQLKDFGKEYLFDTTLEELKLWLDSLDKI